MAAVAAARHSVLAPYLKPDHRAIGSINSPMQCMMKEICAQCLQPQRDPVTGKVTYVFSCFNQDQPLDLVDFPGLDLRLQQNAVQEKLTAQWIALCERPGIVNFRFNLRALNTGSETVSPTRRRTIPVGAIPRRVSRSPLRTRATTSAPYSVTRFPTRRTATPLALPSLFAAWQVNARTKRFVTHFKSGRIRQAALPCRRICNCK